MNPDATSIFKGTFLTVSIRWIDRLIGSVSIFILARLLTPEDFGIVAIASLAVGFANVFLDLGVHVALITKDDIHQSHFDTAWTIRVIQTGIVTLIVLILSPFIAEFFQDERSKYVLYVMAFLPLIHGLENIGVVSYHKNMQFEAEFRFLVLKRLSGFFLMVMLVWIMRSFWALAAGNIIAAFSGVVLSYIMHPMRPRLSLAKFQDIFSISQWMLLKNIGEYFNTNLQKIFVGRWSSTEILGAYTLANKISIMPSSELLAPFNRVLFPAFSKVKDDFQELKRLFLLAQGLQTLIAIPVAVGLALVAHNAVPLILGEKWIKVIPFVQILALIGIIQAIIGTSGYIMIVLGHMRLNVLVTFFQIIVFAVLVVFGFSGSNALVIAWVQLISGVGGMFLAFYLLIRVFPVLKISELFSNSIRPLLGVITMTAVLKFLDSNLELSPVLALSFHVAVGIFIYVLVVLLAWWISKCPSGAESYLLEKIYGIFKNLLELKKKIV